MKANVSYLKTDYNVNPSKRTVYCRLIFGIPLFKIPGINMLDGSDDFRNYLDDLTNPYNGDAWYDEETDMVVFVSEGISKCVPQDNFDADLGKKLANTRAQEKAFKIALEFYNNLLSIVENTFDGLYGLLVGSSTAISKCKLHACDLTGYNPIK